MAEGNSEGQPPGAPIPQDPDKTPSSLIERDEVTTQELDSALRATSQDVPDLTTPIDEAGEGSEFMYKNVSVNGSEFLEGAGVLRKEDVTGLLDRLPEGFFRYVPLDKIVFEPYKMFFVTRNGKIMPVRDSEIQPTDTVMRRARGVTSWNSKIQNGTAVPSDGKMTIQIFSPVDFEEKDEGQTDKDVVLGALAHELGHTTWGMMVDTPRFTQYLERKGIALHRELCPIDYMPVVDAWKQLPESTLPRFQAYKPAFIKEHEREEEGKAKISLSALAAEEDFAVAHDHYLYAQDLSQLDSDRHAMIDLVYEAMDLPTETKM